jgi:hypothetical protein
MSIILLQLGVIACDQHGQAADAKQKRGSVMG